MLRVRDRRPMNATEAQHESKVRFLDAALQVIQTKGYSATRIEDVCDAAKLTKGSFFHHFDSKEEMALAAAGHFAAMADVLFATASYQSATDPLERLLGYVEFRIAILQGSLPEFTCLLGTMVQETYDTHPAIRAACDTHISAHAARVAKDIAEARQGPRIAAECLRHLRRYLETQFTPTKEHEPWPASRKSRRSSGSTATPRRR